MDNRALPSVPVPPKWAAVSCGSTPDSQRARWVSAVCGMLAGVQSCSGLGVGCCMWGGGGWAVQASCSRWALAGRAAARIRRAPCCSRLWGASTGQLMQKDVSLGQQAVVLEGLHSCCRLLSVQQLSWSPSPQPLVKRALCWLPCATSSNSLGPLLTLLPLPYHVCLLPPGD
jgi:hypothetical protein